jgi:hypothetical protein
MIFLLIPAVSRYTPVSKGPIAFDFFLTIELP